MKNSLSENTPKYTRFFARKPPAMIACQSESRESRSRWPNFLPPAHRSQNNFGVDKVHS